MSDICAALSVLAADSAKPAKVRQRAALLGARLSAPIKIGVGGPASEVALDLRQRLPRDLSMADVSDQVGTADIGVWCSDVFGPDEAAFWESAPAALQDHSLLVAAPHPHIADMARLYFRQLCAPDAVSQVLLQTLKLGQEADTDQALALLARHPVTLAAQPAPQVPEATVILAYLQDQADRLAAMDITDTPDSCAAVLEHCAQTVEYLSDLVTRVPETGLQDAVFDALDSITLMGLEGDLGAASDAVDVLISLQTQFRIAVSENETITVP